MVRLGTTGGDSDSSDELDEELKNVREAQRQARSTSTTTSGGDGSTSRTTSSGPTDDELRRRRATTSGSGSEDDETVVDTSEADREAVEAVKKSSTQRSESSVGPSPEEEAEAVKQAQRDVRSDAPKRETVRRTVITDDDMREERVFVVDEDQQLAEVLRETDTGEFVGVSGPGTTGSGGGTRSSETFVEQGLESGGGSGGGGTDGVFSATVGSTTVTGGPRDIAREIETDFLRDNPEFEARDVKVVRTSDGDFSLELTELGEKKVATQNRPSDLDVAMANTRLAGARSSVEPRPPTDVEVATANREVAAVREGLRQQLAGQEQAAAEDVEQQLKRQFELADASALDLTAEDVELVPTGSRTVTEDGVTRTVTEFDVELTEAGRDKLEPFQRKEIELGLEAQIAAEFGRTVDLDPTTDIDFETGTLTTPGEDKVATQPLTDVVADAGSLLDIDLPEQVTLPLGFGTTPVTIDVPSGPLVEGPVVGGVTEQRDFGDAFGGIELPLPIGEREQTPGPAPGPVKETITLDEVFEKAQQPLRDITEIKEQPDEGFENFLEPEAFRGENVRGVKTQQQIVQSALRSPNIIPSSAGKAVDLLDLSEEVWREFIEGDLERVEEIEADLAQTGVNQAALTATDVLEDPGEFAARTTGQLIGTGLIFGGAAAVGPKASQGARAVIQPGEELAGIGGFGVTRRLAGEGTAQRLFPNKEPLIFSEEAFLRGLGKAGRFTGSKAVEATNILRRAEIEPRAGALAGSIPRVRVEPAETEIDDALRRFEEAQRRISLEQGARVRSRFDVEENPVRERARRGFERDVERLGIDAEIEPETTRPLYETALAQDEELLVGERVAGELRQDFASRLLLEQELDREIERDSEFEQEMEQELELELELEQELDPQLERELAFETELEQELELELELESEFESEFELEVEPGGGRRRRRRRRDEDDGGLFARETFTLPGNPEDVLENL